MQGLGEGHAFSSEGFVIAGASLDAILGLVSVLQWHNQDFCSHRYRLGKRANEKRPDLESKRHSCCRRWSSDIAGMSGN